MLTNQSAAQCSEVRSRLWGDIVKQMEGDPTSILTYIR
jgi:hypothetical protein